MTKIALITGAGSGIGRTAAKALSEAGFAIVLTGRDAARLEASAARLTGESLCFAADVSDPAAVKALFAATTSKRIDVAISSITITPERLKSQSFTQPYYDSDMGIATKTDSPIKAEADLKGKIVGVLSGSTGETWVKAHQEADGFSDVKGYDTQQNLLLDLSAGRVDAAVSDIPGMQYSFTKMKDLTVKERIKTGEQYGLMMTKDHPLLGKLNDALSAMKKDGTLAAIHKKWFGSDAPADSSTVKEMPLPKA